MLDNSDAEWWKVSYNGQTGYVVTQYLTVIGGTEPSVSTGGVSIVIPCASATEATRMLELLKTAKVQ